MIGRLLATSLTLLAAHHFVEPVRVITDVGGCCELGWEVDRLADLDGDGLGDLIIGSPGSGQARIYSARTGREIHQFNLPGTELGYSHADAGDVNGDGTADIVIGAPAGRGEVRVYSGADRSLLWVAVGERAGDRFGSSVERAGDIDGDGLSDVLAGAEENDAGGSRSGRGYVLSGRDGRTLRHYEGAPDDLLGSGAAPLRDVDGDGIDEHLFAARGALSGGHVDVYSGATGARLFRLLPDPGAVSFGWFFVADAGDVDADGAHDIYVGDVEHGGGAGRAYVFSGRTGQKIRTFSGSPGSGLGIGRGAGDVDFDGHADLAIGEWLHDSAAEDGGRVRILSGRDGRVLDTVTGAIPGLQLGFDALGVGDVDGDGNLDFVITSPPAGRAWIIAGSSHRLPTNTTRRRAVRH